MKNDLLALDVHTHCQKVVPDLLALYVPFGVACYIRANLFGVGCCFSALDVLFSVELEILIAARRR